MKRVFSIVLFIAVTASFDLKANNHPGTETFTNNGLFFIENKGQVTDTEGKPRADIFFMLKAPGVNIYIGKNSIHYLFSKCNQPELLEKRRDKFKTPLEFADTIEEEITYTSYRLDLFMLNANPDVTVKTGEANEYYENYYNVPSAPEGILGVRTFDRITIQNLYPGIDWVLYIKNNQLKYDLVVHKDADYRQIQMQYKGADEIKLTGEGELFVSTPLGSVTEEKPYTYLAESSKEIKSQYLIDENNIIKFKLNDEVTGGVVIDPGLVWSTYYGGTKDDEAYSVHSDNSEYIYITGYTFSDSYISDNGHQDTLNANKDAFLIKFNSDGVRLWGTYYGGENDDEGNSVYCYSNSIYIVGTTSSTMGIAQNGYQNICYGGTDAYIVKFNNNGNRLWGSYYGGSHYEEGHTVYCDNSENVYLGGRAGSDSLAYNGFQNVYSGTWDFLVVKFTNNGIRLWATYYGNSGYQGVYSVKGDDSGFIYVVGYAHLYSGLASNGYKNTNSGGNDVLLVKFDSSCNRIWATYYGGPSHDMCTSVETDKYANIYISGWTTSSTGVAYNGYQNIYGKRGDGFLVKFNSNGALKWGTYYGGSEEDDANSVIADSAGNVYITGYTNSRNSIANGGYNNITYSGFSAFLVKFNGEGKRLWASYHATKGRVEGNWMCIGNSGNIYLAGLSGGNGSELGVGGYQKYQHSYQDAFLSKIFPEKALFEEVTPGELCPGNSLFIKYNKLQNMSYGNSYTFQLSDTGGRFDNGSLLLTKIDSTKNLDSIIVVVGSDLLPSNNYRLRMFTSSPTDTIYYLDSITIWPKPTLNININDSNQCGLNNNFIFNISKDSSISLVKWYFGDSTTSDSITPVKLYTNYGSYKVKMIVSNSNGCIDSAKQNVFVNPAPITQFSVNNVSQCLLTNNFTFQNTSTINSGSLAYTWSFGDSTGDTMTSPAKIYNDTGAYTVWLKATTDKNCTDSISKIIKVNPHPTADVNIIANNLCGDTTRLEAANVQAGDKFAWLTNGLPSAGDTLPGYKSMQSATAVLTQVNTFGCRDTSPVVNVIVKTIPAKPVLSVNSFTINAGSGYDSYEWYKDGSVINGETDSVIIATQNGNYHCRVTNTDTCENWSDTVSITNVSVYQPGFDNSISIYPNPGNGIINIEFSGKENNYIEVYDMSGRLLANYSTVETLIQLDLQHLAKGVYLIRINSENYSYNSKIIIE